MANGLTGINILRCWVAWRILSLSRRLGLMCEYNGGLKDPQRPCEIQLTDEDINESTKALLNESLADCNKTRLNPFCTLNKPPADDSPLWKKKLQDKPAKKTRTKAKANKKPAKRKTDPSELHNLDDDDDDDDSEVELDSLGSFCRTSH